MPSERGFLGGGGAQVCGHLVSALVRLAHQGGDLRALDDM
jgi:hypothetical protein